MDSLLKRNMKVFGEPHPASRKAIEKEVSTIERWIDEVEKNPNASSIFDILLKTGRVRRLNKVSRDLYSFGYTHLN